MAFKRWLYRGGRPNALAKLLNYGYGLLHSSGIAPNTMVTLEVAGRRSGKRISFPLALVVVEGERYIVSMLGENANWVQNLRAAGGKAVLRHGVREDVTLDEVEAGGRAAIIKAYLRIAPGARPHIPLDMDAPLAEFEQIAPNFPVFKIRRDKTPL